MTDRGTDRQARLSPQWAFVLQLREGTSFAPAHLCGRIEHVSSGQACLFDSLDDARTFMERVTNAMASNKL
jgi:hypothetical protein